METAFAGISGAVIGSFLNVVVYRLPLGQSLVAPRSHCPSCDTPVAPRDNVPLLSWLFLKGRCRHCGESISPRYPAVELLTALCFVAVVLARGIHAELVALIPFTAVLIAVTFIDIEHKIVPNKIMARRPSTASPPPLRSGRICCPSCSSPERAPSRSSWWRP